MEVSVIVPTRDRPDSLHETLKCLMQAGRDGLRAEVVVVDNSASGTAEPVVHGLRRSMELRYLHEPRQGVYGKSHALNCALEAGGLGDLVAVLDDDMSVESGWLQGVVAISRRWSQCDIFSGHTYPIWPDMPLPEWASHPVLQGWLFSVQGSRRGDVPLASGHWFLGGHFWFRSRVLAGNRRFEDTWFTEPYFMLDLVADGYRGVRGPDAVAGHRIQPGLLDPGKALERASQAGRAFADVRLRRFRATVRNARLAHAHPFLARLYCAGAWVHWSLKYLCLRGVPPRSRRFAELLVATERKANYREAVRILFSSSDYKLFGGRRDASRR